MAIYRKGQASMDAQGYITGYGTNWREQLTLIRSGATIIFLTQPLHAAVITEVVNDTSIRAITTGGAVVPRSEYIILLHDSLTVDGLAQDIAETLRYYMGKESEFAGFIEIIKDFDWDKLQKIKEDVKTNADAAAASQKAAKTSENNAKTSATNAENSKKGADTAKAAAESARDAANTAKTGAETARKGAETARDAANTAKAGAESARDQAEEYAKQAAEPYKDLLQPLPDVWIPFNDSLDMITGFAPGYKSITVGDDVITLPSEKVVSFTRASTATYIDKSGCFAEAAINEPRFEKDGLLIEGQRTNTFSYTNTPASWNYDTANLTITTGVDEYGFSYGLFGVKETSTTERATIISTGYSRVIDVAANESVTLSCRVKKINGEGIITLRPRISFVNDDGTSNTLVAGSYIDCETGDVLSFSGGDAVNHVVYREANGWLRVEFTYKSPEAKSMYGRFEMGADKRAIKKGDQIMMTTPQFEKGTHASSFIITSETGATRASDMVTIPIKLNWSTPAISCLVEVNTLWNLGYMPNLSGAARILDITTKGDSADIIGQSYMYLGFTSRGSAAVVTNGHTSYTTEYRSILARSKRHNIVGFLFSEDRKLQVVVNGVFGSLITSEHQNQKYAGGTITIGGYASSGSRHLFGHIRNLRIWHKALTDHQMGEIV